MNGRHAGQFAERIRNLSDPVLLRIKDKNLKRTIVLCQKIGDEFFIVVCRWVDHNQLNSCLHLGVVFRKRF